MPKTPRANVLQLEGEIDLHTAPEVAEPLWTMIAKKQTANTTTRIQKMKSALLRFLLPIAMVLGLGLAFASADDETRAQLKAQAKINRDEAAKTAIAKVPGGKIKSAELEKEHGKLIWSFDISTPKSKNISEVQVDAKTGKIISTQIETREDQVKEAAADKKEKK